MNFSINCNRWLWGEQISYAGTYVYLSLWERDWGGQALDCLIGGVEDWSYMRRRRREGLIWLHCV